MEVVMDEAWAAVDAGKEFHWAHVLDASGRELLSRKVENDEADILRLIEEALSLAESSSGRWISQEVEQLCCWLFCGNETRESSTFPVSPLTGPVTPTAVNPKPMPERPASHR
jgi:hypothetical protein